MPARSEIIWDDEEIIALYNVLKTNTQASAERITEIFNAFRKKTNKNSKERSLEAVKHCLRRTGIFKSDPSKEAEWVVIPPEKMIENRTKHNEGSRQRTTNQVSKTKIESNKTTNSG